MSNPWRDVPARVFRSGLEEMHKPENREFQCCPSIVQTAGGRLWAAWMSGGDREPHVDNYAVIAYSDDQGATWVDPFLIIDHPERELVRVNYVVLWTDEKNQLWICWSQTAADWDRMENEHLSSFAVHIANPDAATPLQSKPMFMFPALLHNKPTRLSNGEWLFATEHIFHRETSFIYACQTLGEVPVLRGKVHSHCPWKLFHEARLVERRDGSLWLLSRIDSGMYGGMEESVSLDGGRTWTEFSMNLPAPLRGPGSRFHITRLKSGALLLINHDHEKKRCRLAAWLSDDDGQTWTTPYVFDGREGVSYPDAAETIDGRIMIIYDRNRSTDAEILIHVLTEADIRRGKKSPEIISRRR